MRVNLGFAAVCYQLDQIGVEHHGFAQRDEFRPARFPGLGDVVGGVEFATPIKGKRPLIRWWMSFIRYSSLPSRRAFVEIPQRNVQVLQRFGGECVHQRERVCHR